MSKTDYRKLLKQGEAYLKAESVVCSAAFVASTNAQASLDAASARADRAIGDIETLFGKFNDSLGKVYPVGRDIASKQKQLKEQKNDLSEEEKRGIEADIEKGHKYCAGKIATFAETHAKMRSEIETAEARIAALRSLKL